LPFRIHTGNSLLIDDMLTHQTIWKAIDLIAQRCGTTPSGLARRAGFDATTFNRSKRISPDGRERWPSMETIAKILKVAEMDLVAFGELVNSISDEPVGSGQRPAPPKQDIKDVA
jgi:hypothetical protein